MNLIIQKPFPENTLQRIEGIDVAHNAQNYGNFLWGAAGASLKIPPMLLLLAAQINSTIYGDETTKIIS